MLACCLFPEGHPTGKGRGSEQEEAGKGVIEATDALGLGRKGSQERTAGREKKGQGRDRILSGVKEQGVYGPE